MIAPGAYLCSPVPMLPGTYVPRTYVPRYLCSPVPMFPGTYVPRYLCSPNLCSPVPMFPGTYVPRYLCSVEGCPLLSRQVEARDAVWIADEVVQSRRRSCQPIVFPAGPESGLLRHAWGRQIAEMMGLLGEGAT